MKQFSVIPVIKMMDTVEEFTKEYSMDKKDLVFVSGSVYKRFGSLLSREGIHIVNFANYPKGEPTDLLVEGLCKEIAGIDYDRVIAIGGGTVIDVAKLFSLEKVSPVVDLFQKKIPAIRSKKLVLIPTTCGTGSEVTNISILELTTINSKFGLAVDELYADEAVLIPELVKDIPLKFFATSAIDALIHSIESYTSPKANAFTQAYSLQAMSMILKGFQAVAKGGDEAKRRLAGDFLYASCMAGIAFGNAGCAAVHAMSYPLGATHHVPHGEANYAMFTGVYKTYQAIDPDGAIKDLNAFLADILSCESDQIYVAIEALLDQILPKKALHEYGVTQEELVTYTETVMTQQTRLMNNNYVELDGETVMEIYQSLF